MKKLLIGLVVMATSIAFVLLGVKAFHLKTAQSPIGGSGSVNFFYNSATMATSSVGIYSWSNILSADSSRGYVSLCNNSGTTGDAVYLHFGTASTTANVPAKPYGYRLAANSCYEMTLDKMFYGPVYGIASTATSTLLKVTGSY